MSATQTSTSTDSRKLMPMKRAWATASSTTAVITRCLSMSGGFLRGLRDLLRRLAEAPLARRVVGKRGVERGGVEIGPELLAEIQLRIRRLPQQEIGDALLAAGADDEVGVGHVRQRHRRCEAGLGDR